MPQLCARILLECTCPSGPVDDKRVNLFPQLTRELLSPVLTCGRGRGFVLRAPLARLLEHREGSCRDDAYCINNDKHVLSYSRLAKQGLP
jgi:hypothetical protein